MNKAPDEVANLVRGYFDRTQFDGINMVVLDDEVRLDGLEWRIPVHPSTEPDKRYPFYEYLADIEGELESNEHLSVFLVPADPVAECAA